MIGITLHLLLAVGLVLPGIAAPAQRVSEAAALASGTTQAMTHSACDGTAMLGKAPMKTPGSTQGCDLAACLGAGCLPALPHLAAFVPDAESPLVVDQPVLPSQQPDTLLRPPIV